MRAVKWSARLCLHIPFRNSLPQSCQFNNIIMLNPCHEGHYIVDNILKSILIMNVVNEWVTGISVLALIHGQTQQHYWTFTLPVCILEWTLWDPYTYKNISMPESVQKFACKVCLKQWELDYDSMLHLLGITRLSTRRQYLKLVLLYKAVNGKTYFPPGIFCS